MTSVRGNQADAGAGTFGGCNQTASAQFQVGAVGFGLHWSAEDSLAAANVRLHYELEEANARVAVLEEEQRILKATIEGLRDALCEYKCHDKARADGGWANI
jgi:cell division protein FtsB